MPLFLPNFRRDYTHIRRRSDRLSVTLATSKSHVYVNTFVDAEIKKTKIYKTYTI